MAITRTLTQSGLCRGFATETPGVSAFLGIPYAQPPVGDRRWRMAEPALPWEGERDCTHFGPSCWQRDNTKSTRYAQMMARNPVPPVPFVMDEDCLFLNIWTPAEGRGERYPVMVWFYGGNLQAGTTADNLFDGEGLCPYGVVLVTVNYRTGVFGYFGHPDLEAENEYRACGNYGLGDQICALEWIHRNIMNFGGDPGNVTIFGCSGGGRSVQGVCCAKRSLGLVHHAVCHSAGGLNPHYSTPYDTILEYGREFMAMCGKKDLAQLRDVPAGELQAAYERFGKTFNITADGYLLPWTMDEVVRRGEQADVDYILSTMNDEFVMPAPEGLTKDNFQKFAVRMGIRTSIFGRICRPETDAEAKAFMTRAECYEMKSAQLAWAQVQAGQPKKPVRLCTNVHPMPGTGRASHGDDQYYIFHTMRKFWNPFTEEDEELSRTLRQYWTNFAKTGDPNGPGLAEWTPYTKESPLTLTIDAGGCKMEDRSRPMLEKLAKTYIENREH